MPLKLYYLIEIISGVWIVLIIKESREAVSNVTTNRILDFEQGREAAGLFVVIFAMIFISTKKSKSNSLISYAVFFVFLALIITSLFAPKLFTDFTDDSHCSGMFIEPAKVVSL